MTDAGLDRLKTEVRRRMRAARAAATDPGAALGLVASFPIELKGLSPVAGYWPMGSELDPRPLLTALAEDGAAIALPRVETRAGMVRFLQWRAGEILEPDAFGAPAPPASAREIVPRLILTPLVAFDRAGRRLGQGGGHYDRILATLRPGAIAAGLAYAAQEMPEVPAGAHDQGLDWVITEREAIRCA
ncbi:MAG: 5-formyltetrahydrofolate cyclo-ligase [Hyphomonadaceae bacterium]|nr:5-formyltetrahydrofolate cyclo-ligase [Hyphomonadaceae bacterium]